MAHKLVEHDEEIALLYRIGAEALTDGRFVAVLGEGGIGKTTLLGVARSMAEGSGVTALAARASELERDLAFGIVRQLVDPVLIARSPQRRDALFSGAAALARAVLLPEEGAVAEEHHSDLGAQYGLYWLVANLAQEKAPLSCSSTTCTGPTRRRCGSCTFSYAGWLVSRSWWLPRGGRGKWGRSPAL